MRVESCLPWVGEAEMGRSSAGIAVVRLFPTWQRCSCCPMQRCCGRLGLSSAAPWAVSSPLERGPRCHFPSFASCWVHRNGPAPFCAFLLQGRETLILIAPYAECQARGWAGIPLAPTQPARAWLLGKPGSHFTPPPPHHHHHSFSCAFIRKSSQVPPGNTKQPWRGGRRGAKQ